MRTLLLLFLLTSCAVFDTPFVPEWDRGPDTPKVYVEVDEQWQMDALCGKAQFGKKILGCAYIPANPAGVCKIVTYTNGAASTLKHEKDHCQYGRYHP